MKLKFLILCVALAAFAASVSFADPSVPKENFFAAKPFGIQIAIKMAGPFSQDADLQIICLLKHKASGDTYQGAATETNEKLGGMLAALRDRGEFVGDLGETILFTPPKGSIPARRFMIIGLGDEQALSLDTLRLVGRIAAREAVRLKATHVAWAPVIRDEGNSVIEVGLGDRTFTEQFLSAYDTEKRLQAQGLEPRFNIKSLTIEAGPAFFDSAVRQVGQGIDSMPTELSQRDSAPYSSITN